MIFGRKRRGSQPTDEVAVGDLRAEELDADDPEAGDADTGGASGGDEEYDAPAADDPDAADDEPAGEGDIDPRADGPFDYDEVDLDADNVSRLTFGPLVITPFDGLGLQVHGDEKSSTIYALLALYEGSGLELALFAAPTSGGLAQELREDAIEEAEQSGGNAELLDGPFGPEIRIVLPLEGSEGEQMFRVSRTWMAEGPRWLLRGTLMGAAAMTEGEAPPADVFVEFFRNVVVRRDDTPRVPGERITLALPQANPEE